MRILMLNHNLIGRGSYLRCFHLAKRLVRRGHEVDILTCADEPSSGWRVREIEGVTVSTPPRFGKPGVHDGGYAPVDILARIPRAMRMWDLIHAFEHRPNVSVPAMFSRLRRTPLVTDWSDWWTRGGITTPRRRFGWVDRCEGALIEEGTKKLSDVVTVVSKCLWDRALDIGIHENRLAMIPSGCDLDRIDVRDRETCRRELGMETEGPVLGFVGFAFWDFEFLIRSFEIVLSEFPTARLAVTGQDKDGQAEEIVNSRLCDRADRVVFLGQFDPADLSTPLGVADVQLLPLPDTLANQARWPIKFGDYLASGRPSVLCDVGDAARVAREEQAGEITAPTPEAFAEGILSLLRDPNEAREMGNRARSVAEQKLSWEIQTEKMEAVYVDLLAKKK